MLRERWQGEADGVAVGRRMSAELPEMLVDSRA
jgi:hypothetical protein